MTPRVNAVEVGGLFQFLGSVQYQFPVTADESIQLVAFSDFGSVEEDVTLDNFRVTVGGGFRIQIPQMGPVPLAFRLGGSAGRSELRRPAVVLVLCRDQSLGGESEEYEELEEFLLRYHRAQPVVFSSCAARPFTCAPEAGTVGGDDLAFRFPRSIACHAVDS